MERTVQFIERLDRQTTYLPCPGCGKTPEGKTPRSYLRATCTKCGGTGFIIKSPSTEAAR